MATVPDAAVAHYKQMQALQALAVKAARRAWTGVDDRYISESWAPVVSRDLAPVISALQVKAATSGASYGAAALAEQGSWVAPDDFLDPGAFADYGSMGVGLDSTLYHPAIAAKDAISHGASGSQALLSARSVLETIVMTTVADSGRQAASIDVAARKGVGYVRMLNPPSCARCVILAGRFYRWNAGFRRHPRCDCVHVMSTAGSTQAALDEGLIDNPYDYFHSLSSSEQDAIFGKGYSDAIRDGGDIYQVVNSKRGRIGAFTTEGTTRRGYASTALNPGQRRMTPDAIYRTARTREEALQALRDQGYILPGGQVPGGSLRGARYEGFGQMGRGGTRKAASQAVLDARVTGIRDPASRYTMTAAERRLYDAEQRWISVLEGRNPYASPAFGNIPDPRGLRAYGRSTSSGARAPLTPKIAAQVEADYRRLLVTNGEKFAAADAVESITVRGSSDASRTPAGAGAGGGKPPRSKKSGWYDNEPDPSDKDAYDAFWRARQDRLAREHGIDFDGATLLPAEVRFAERMQRRGETFRWINEPARNARGYRGASNDFVWISRSGEQWEHKAPDSASYKAVRNRIRDDLSKGKTRFVIDLEDLEADAELLRSLVRYARQGRIRALAVLSKNGSRLDFLWP